MRITLTFSMEDETLDGVGGVETVMGCYFIGLVVEKGVRIFVPSD